MLSALGVQFGLVSCREVLKVGRFDKVRDYFFNPWQPRSVHC